MRNIDDGIGLTNVGDGALTEVHSMLQRLKTLALKSAKWNLRSIQQGNLEHGKKPDP